MTVVLAALALSALSPSLPSAAPSGDDTAQVESAQIETAARSWLEMIDRADWAGSYAGTTAAFRQANTLATWQAVSEKVRAPLGAVTGRRLLSNDLVPTPQGYRLVKFTTRFASRGDVVETVTLMREGGAWKVVGVMIG